MAWGRTWLLVVLWLPMVAMALPWAEDIATARDLLNDPAQTEDQARRAAALMEGTLAARDLPERRRGEAGYLLGRARLALGDAFGAVGALRGAVAAEPRQALYRLWLADAYHADRRETLAIETYRAALDEPAATDRERDAAREALTALQQAPAAEALLPATRLAVRGGVLRYELGDPAAAECAAALARASERLTQRTGLAPPTGVEIVLFPSASSYHAYHELRGSARPEWSTACTAGGRIMLYGAEADRDQLTGTLGHELTHLTVRGAADGRTVPVWLDEGLAALVGGQFAEARGVLQRTGLHLALEALHVPSFAAYEQADAYLAYATSRVLVEDLLRAGTGPLGAYLSALGAGASAEDAFVAAWGVSLADYYTAWAAALADA